MNKFAQLIAVVLFVLSPLTALAAGFASQSIFLSTSPVVEGDAVKIYVSVTNPGASTFKGSVVVSESDNVIGTMPLTLTTGGAQMVSVAWKPVAGTHTLTASIKDTDSTLAETQQTFTVQEKPKPKTTAPDSTNNTSQTDLTVESSDGIQHSIQSISPAAGNAAKPVFNTLDGVRQSIASVADQQLANVKPKISQGQSKGQVEGASTEAKDQPWYLTILYTIYFYILTLIRFLVGSAGIFYPLLAILFLYVLYRMFRRYRRG